jgi:hypothetical protein
MSFQRSDDELTAERAGQRRPSIITFAMKKIGPRRAPEIFTSSDERFLLKMCYLWPMTGCVTFLPFVVFVRFYDREALSMHAKQGCLMASAYTFIMIVLGALNGLLGRFVESWLSVTVVFGGFALCLMAASCWLGLRYFRRAARGEEVEIPLVTRLALKF